MNLSDIRMRDPFVLPCGDGRYLLFGTTDENLWGGPGTGFDCYETTDFVTWTGPIPAFRPPAGFWGTTQFWAPEVHVYDGAHFMFATFAGELDGHLIRGTAILRADDPAGPYLPWSDGPVTPHELPCLDGTLYVDEDDQPWIVYSRGAEGTSRAPALADGQMHARRLSPDLRAPVGDPVILFHSSDAPWSRPFRLPEGVEPPPDLHLADDPYFTDGAFFLPSTTGPLHLLWSACADSGYAIGVATSPSGSLLGPWTQSPTPLWQRNGGHAMVFAREDGQAYLAFHSPNESPHERVMLVPVQYTDDGLRLLA